MGLMDYMDEDPNAWRYEKKTEEVADPNAGAVTETSTVYVPHKPSVAEVKAMQAAAKMDKQKQRFLEYQEARANKFWKTEPNKARRKLPKGATAEEREAFAEESHTRMLAKCKSRYNELKAKGLCVTCGAAPASGGRVRCEACATQNRYIAWKKYHTLKGDMPKIMAEAQKDE